MTEIVLAINEQDCSSDDGNTAEEFEAIAVTLLRAAAAIRNQEEGKLECFGHDGKALAWVHLHACGPTVTNTPWRTRRQLRDLTACASPTSRCERCHRQ